MTAKQQALMDIKKELKENHKSFLAFRTNLNPVMDKLVNDYIHLQNSLSFPHPHTRTNSQLIAHCFLAKGVAHLYDYTKYYDK